MEYNGIEYNKRKAWIQTRSGVKFHLLGQEPFDFLIADIAHGLSNVCRFAGHTKSFYSVAEHSVRVSNLLGSAGCGRMIQYAGLMHDASEAYISDMASPLKYLPEFDFYREIERKMMSVIAETFAFPFPMPDEVKQADEILLGTEARDLMAPVIDGWHLRYQHLDHKIRPWSPHKARRRFLAMYRELNPFGMKPVKRFFFF